MGEWFESTAASGSLLLAVPVAVIAGLVSFFSPCVIPLLPAYFSYATGLTGAELIDGTPRRGRMLGGSLLFVLGFTGVFVAWGVAFGALGDWLFTWQRQLTLGLGLLTIVLGLVFMGALPWLQRDVRIHRVPAVGLVAAPFLGVLFALGWTPCVGPTLGAIQTLAFAEASAGRGALLSACYALGLGIPFVVAGLAYQRALGAFGLIRRHQVWLMRLGGLMLVTVGVLLITGWWDYLTSWLQLRLVSSFETTI
ncbi:MAG: cytochrome c biogenesis CcdA family protein [Nocardioides sp.]